MSFTPSQLSQTQTQGSRRAKRFKIIVCPVHGHMEFPAELLKVIDSAEFQRLRDLKQLGAAEYVFPSAVHTRLTHSLGVGHLAHRLMSSLQQRQPYLGITHRDVFLVTLAGICHDLGHGPFSHSFETVVRSVLEAEHAAGRTDLPRTWSHEDASEALLDRIVETTQLDIRPEEVDLVKAMIRGVDRREDHAYPGGKPLFYFQIVANKQTGMDVDKYDYLLRDAKFCGVCSSFDMSRLMSPMVRIDKRGDKVLAYYRKEQFMIHQLFRTRYDMHNQVYGHSVVQAITLMLQEVLFLARHWLHIAEAITDPALYVRLTDSVIHHIDWLDPESPPATFPKEDLLKAKRLIDRVRRRELYRNLVGREFLLPNPDQVVTRAEAHRTLMDALFEHNPELKDMQDRFIVHTAERDFARKERNPLLSVPFYSNRDDPHAASQRTASCLRPAHVEFTTMPRLFCERYVRIYICDKNDERCAEALRLAVARISDSRSAQNPALQHASDDDAESHDALEDPLAFADAVASPSQRQQPAQRPPALASCSLWQSPLQKRGSAASGAVESSAGGAREEREEEDEQVLFSGASPGQSGAREAPPAKIRRLAGPQGAPTPTASCP
eukprot:TRINITY_DN23705_c0_g1_i1.p1 TRINITY_DN23705_c0_g1~~TRINITY_DN23705_c0_g1_i1.p1  ORF type:complete len:609 (+),score=235.87 TRINITY_DN23705_c0_g1_i1:87-1913(+)